MELSIYDLNLETLRNLVLQSCNKNLTINEYLSEYLGRKIDMKFIEDDDTILKKYDKNIQHYKE